MIHQRLVHWEGNLPAELRLGASRQREVIFLAGMLHMAYKYVIVIRLLQLLDIHTHQALAIFMSYFIDLFSCRLQAK